jgi:hypothetical protein
MARVVFPYVTGGQLFFIGFAQLVVFFAVKIGYMFTLAPYNNLSACFSID